MMNILSLIQIIFIILILLTLLTQTVSIKIVKSDKLLLEFNFVFLAFSINLNQKKKKARKKTGFKHRLASYLVIKRTLVFGLSRSHLELRRLYFASDSNNENAFLIKGILNIPIASFVAYLEQISASFKLSAPSKDSDASIDAVIRTPLFHLIFTALFYFKEQLKSKYKVRARK